MDDLIERLAVEKIVRPIVEGQIRGFIKEHPSILKGVDWYKRRDDKSVTLVNSLSKRIVRDLTCPTTRARLEMALLEVQAGAPSVSSVAGSTAAKPGRVEASLRALCHLLSLKARSSTKEPG